ncbi:MAG: ATP-binding protein [Proteobacteria bacterium]|nr:ATP-binding protein [Pseudomonadota bacterium]
MDSTLIERLIADFEQRPLPQTVEREIRLPMMERKADTLIGMRRAGKTYLMFDAMRRLLKAGIPRQRMLYLNLEDERLANPTVATLDVALETFFRLHPQSRALRSYLFLDEIQVVAGWERFIRRVLDTEDVQVVLTGSSAKLLSTEVASSLRGRGVAVEVLPYSLREAARAAGIDSSSRPPGSRRRSELAGHAVTYLTHGASPRSSRPTSSIAPRCSRTTSSWSCCETSSSVTERRAWPSCATSCGRFCGQHQGFSISKLHGALRSQGVKVGKQTLLEYLDHLADAYLCFLVAIRSRSAKQRVVNPRKVYAVDPGLAAAMTSGGATNIGALLENTVYLELRRRYGRLADDAITYYRSRSGFEVDFVVEAVGRGSGPELIQVCASLADPETSARELRALDEAMLDLGLRSATIVTLHEEKTLETRAGTVRIEPLWQWALQPRER